MDVRRSAEQAKKPMSLGGYTIAVIGAWVAFLPLLQILLPVKAAEIAPGQAMQLLGVLAASGAAVAGVANLVVGWLSDRTKSRFGRRRPWMIAGLCGVVASYVAIWRSDSSAGAIAAIAAFQISFNMVFSPLLALMSDYVPEARRGWASALIGLGKPVGTAVGTIAVGAIFVGEGARFLVLAGFVLLTIAPFALRLREDRLELHPEIAQSVSKGSVRSRLSINFVLAWLSRICVLMTFTVVQLYLLYYLEAMSPGLSAPGLGKALTLLAIMFGVVSAATGLAAGKLSDMTRRRKPFVVGSAIAIGASMTVMGEASSWPAATAGYALFAAGAGVHGAVEFAMIVDILPSRDHAARDLGMLNISNILPQILAPLAVGWIEAFPGSSISWAFGASAVAAVVALLLVGIMRGVR